MYIYIHVHVGSILVLGVGGVQGVLFAFPILRSLSSPNSLHIWLPPLIFWLVLDNSPFMCTTPETSLL